MIKAEISSVEKGSIAEKLGIEAGDFLIGIDGNEICDVIEYENKIYKTNLKLEVEKKEGLEKKEYIINKEKFEPLGMEFSDVIFDKVKTCKNNCVFCFVSQLPKGMRHSVYIKDEDFRTSFMFGSYMTLSNMSDSDMERVISQQLSPLYVSVHATDAQVRESLLRNKEAGNILEKIKKLTEAGIELHTQAVLVPEINDGDILKKTVEDLAAFYPMVKSLSIVPVGLTKYNKNNIRLFKKEESQKICEYILLKGEEFKKKFGTNFVFIADEFIIKAGYNIPENSYYEKYEVLENGIGLVRILLDKARKIQKKKKKGKIINKTIACGESIYPFIKTIAEKDENISVIPIKNYFFGETVTVTGLITGSDLIQNLKERDLGDELYIDGIMLNDDNKFLDDLTLEDVEKELKKKIKVIYSIEEVFQ